MPPVYFLISVDTEPDLPSWKDRPPYRLSNIKGLPALQGIFDRYGAKPAYLVTYSVATDAESADILSRLRTEHRCEIGSHFHPAETPPFLSKRRPEGSCILSLPDHVRRDKLRNLTGAIEARFGKPTSHRAGRYRFDAGLARLLVEAGYKVDLSVTPHVSWVPEGGCSFIRCSEQPYWVDLDDVSAPGASDLLEIPITITLENAIRSWQLCFLPLCSMPLQATRLRKWIERLRPVRPQWFRPTYASLDALKRLSDILIGERGATMIQMMFHSNELTLGANPFYRTAEAIARVHCEIDEICRYLTERHQVTPVTPQEYYQLSADRFEQSRRNS
jgi:hypothetical protein